MNPVPSVIHFNCLSCGIMLTVPAQAAGVSGPCPHCGAIITSPAASPPPAPVNPFAPPQQLPMGGLATQPVQQLPPQHILPPPQQPQPQPAASAPPLGSMAGPNWPPAAQAASHAAPEASPQVVPQPGRTSGAHPVMERLLHTQASLPATTPPSQPPLPTTTPPYQQRSSGPPRRRVSSSREKGRFGAMLLALCMAGLVLVGTAWFFRDQLRAAWVSYTIKDDDTLLLPDLAPPKSGELEPTKFDPGTSALPKAIPIAPPFTTEPAPGAAAQNSDPEYTVRPAMPATSPDDTSNPDSAPSGGNLVEIPGATASGPPASVVPAPPPAPPLVTGVTDETKPALAALQNFFQAKTWQERLPFVQAQASMKPLMESYYSASPDGPLHVSHIQMIRYDRAPETGPPHCVFQVSGGGLKRPLPIMVETTDSGWKVDWLTFTEFKDDLLLKFLEEPQPEPARFHVLMRRAHYFGDDVPALDKKVCLQIMPPMPGFTGNVFSVKGTPVSRDLDKFLGWEVSQAAAVVELQWRKDDSYQWVELTNLIQLNWRNVDPAQKSAPGASARKQPAEPEPPKAVPVE